MLHGTLDSKLFIISPAREVRTIARDEITVSLLSGWIGEDGVLWFGGADARVYRGQLDGDVLDLTPFSAPAPSGQALYWIATGTTGTDFELVVLDARGAVQRHTNSGGWELVHEFAPRVETALPKGGIVRVSPEEWLIGWGFDTQLARLTSGRLTLERPDGLTEGITALVQVPELGTVIGTALSGRAFVHDSLRWRSLGSEGVGIDAISAFPFDDGFLLGGAAGALRQYSRRDGFCEKMNIAALGITHILRLNEVELLFISEAATSGGIVTFVRHPSLP